VGSCAIIIERRLDGARRPFQFFDSTPDLLNRDLTKAADGGLATLTVVGDIGHHEDLAASRRDLEQETRYRCVAEFVRDPCMSS
jgi:hypothetical protein